MRLGIFFAVACAVSSNVFAETAEYQIRRLVYLGSSCGIESLARSSALPGHERFKVMCRNVSAYPNGLEVVCTDPADDRSCRIVTPAATFDQLELLQPKIPAVP
jgi:hypothetical protein